MRRRRKEERLEEERAGAEQSLKELAQQNMSFEKRSTSSFLAKRENAYVRFRARRLSNNDLSGLCALRSTFQ